MGAVLDQLVQLKEKYKNDFLDEEQKKWLKKYKTEMPREKLTALTMKANGQYLIKASKLSYASHVCKFSHPDAKTSSVIVESSFNNDGFLRSGNVVCKNDNRLDVVRSAQLSPVGKFLLLIMEDGKTIVEHLEMNSESIRREFEMMQEDYERLRAVILAVKKNDLDQISDARVKQVYFPVSDNYHLLSILTSSSIVSEARGRIEKIRENARNTRTAKDKNDELYGKDFDEINDLTEIHFGGSNPQNISELLTRTHGSAWLLPSFPPSFSPRNIVRPGSDFFSNTLRSMRFEEYFRYLHALLECQKNNRAMRDKVKQALNAIIDQVMHSVVKLREIEPGWSERDNHLSLEQRIWLDEVHADERKENEEWMEEISHSFAQWIMRTYEKILKDDRILLGDGELEFLQGLVIEALQEDKENWI